MKFIKILFVILISSSAFAQEARRENYSIDRLLDIALKQDPNYKIATLDETLWKFKRRQTASALLPKIDATLDTRHNIKQQSFILPSSAFGVNDGSYKRVLQGTPWNANAALDAQLSIFNPTAIANLKLVSIQSAQAKIDMDARKEYLKYEISGIYYQLSLAQSKADLYASNTKALRDVYEEIKIRLQKGAATSLEVDQAKLDYELALYNEELCGAEVQNLLSKLEKLTGKLEQMPITKELAMVYIEVKQEEVSQDISNRSDYRMQTQKNAENQRIFSSRFLGYLPQVNLTSRLATQGFRNKFDFFNKLPWYSYSYVGVDIKFPIFDGANREYAVKITKLEMDKGVLKAEEISRNAHAVQVEASNNFRMAQMQVKLHQMEMEAHKLRRVSMDKQLKIGTITSADMAKLNSEYVKINQNLLQAYEKVLRSNLELNKAKGTL